jgi:o-succinylbenzoate---CoA ligase
VPRLLTPVALGTLPIAEALDRIRAAIAGDGDALLAVPTDVAAVQRLAALRPGTPLLDTEDDESDPTALVVATSGSTGEPKGALLPGSALRASATATHDRLGGPGTWLLALATHHVAGVQVLVRSVLAGTEPEVLGPGHPFDVHAFARATDRLRRRTDGCCYTALVPTQLVRLLDAGGQARDALAAFDAVLVGGAAASPSLLARAADAGVRVVTSYGMTETCGGSVYDGVALDGVQVAVDRGESSSAGRIRLGGPVVARGYRGRPDAGQFTHVDGTRWFTTNDLGRWDEGSSVLTVLGRSDDVIVTGGEKVAPQSVEAIVSGMGGIAECLVVGVPDDRWGRRVVALLVGSSGPTDEAALLGEIRHAVKARLGAAAAPHDVLLVDALPASALGKPDRRAAEALAAARLAIASRHSEGGVR